MKNKIEEKLENYLNNLDIITESGLSRIWQFIEEDRSFGTISAFRHEYSNKENLERHKQLKIDIRKLGYGYVELNGGFNEDGHIVSELSCFIPNISKKQIIELGVKYEQYSVLYKDKNEFVEVGTNKHAGIGSIKNHFLFKSSSKNLSLDKNSTKEFFSSLVKGSHRGRNFVFNTNESFLNEKITLSFNEIAYSHKKLGEDENWIRIF